MNFPGFFRVFELRAESQGVRVSNRSLWLRLLVILLVILVCIILAHETDIVSFFISKKRMLAFLQSLGPAGFVGFILLQAAQVVFAPIPGEVTGLLGGFVYGPVLGTILSTVGLTIGSYIAFALSRTFGRPFVDRFVNKAVMDRFDYLLHHKGAFLVFLLFLIPGFPKDYLCYILGLGHLSTIEFIVIGGIGRLFGTILLTLGGTYIRKDQYLYFLVLTGVAIAVVIIAMLFRSRIERWFRILHVRDYKRRKTKRLRGRHA